MKRRNCFLMLILSAQVFAYGSPTVIRSRGLSTVSAGDPVVYEPARGRDRDPLDQGADWCPATVIPSAPYIDFGTATGQANDWNPACAQCCQGEDVIYQFTPTFTTVYRVSLCLSSSFDSILEIRTDGPCPGSNL